MEQIAVGYKRPSRSSKIDNMSHYLTSIWPWTLFTVGCITSYFFMPVHSRKCSSDHSLSFWTHTKCIIKEG